MEGPRLARATVRKSFSGGFTGDSTAELLMCQADASDYSAGAGYVALERVVGVIGDLKGSFVVQHGGIMGGGAEEKSFGYVVPGSGRGDFAGIAGSVVIGKDGDGKHTLTMDHQIT